MKPLLAALQLPLSFGNHVRCTFYFLLSNVFPLHSLKSQITSNLLICTFFSFKLSLSLLSFTQDWGVHSQLVPVSSIPPTSKYQHQKTGIIERFCLFYFQFLKTLVGRPTTSIGLKVCSSLKTGHLNIQRTPVQMMFSSSTSGKVFGICNGL